MDNEIAIRVVDLSKKYKIGKQKDGSLRGSLANLFSSKKSRTEDFLALNGVSFDIQKGDVIGIIGKNGAGKSTLLKILSQITKPSKGRIEINGRVASLLEVGTGFHPELTGRENIYLNGTILGMSRKEVKSKFDEIVEFSGVEKFIDTPVKYYSSGMYVRLAFAVAAHLEPEILIIDEVLAVGDAEFQKKCLGKMQDVASHGRTVLFVSHNMQAVLSLTKKCILINSGRLQTYGPSNDVVQAYSEIDKQKEVLYLKSVTEEQPQITKVQLITSESGNLLIHNDKAEILVEVYLSQPLTNGGLTIQIFNSSNMPIVHFWIFDSEKKILQKKGLNRLKCVIPKCKLFFGKYTLTVYLTDFNGRNRIEMLENICPFSVEMYNTHRDHPWNEGTSTYLDDFYWEEI